MMQALLDASSHRSLRVLAALIGCVALAAGMLVAIDHPVPVLGALLVACGAITVVRYPTLALVVLLFVVPFDNAIFNAVRGRAHLAAGPLDYWKDALIIALFVRGVAERLRADPRLRFPRHPGDGFMVAYVLAYMLIAAASPQRSTLYAALGLYVEGPLLFLAIRFLRPNERQLWACAAAMLAAATVIAAGALIERFGPRLGFHEWYGAVLREGGGRFVDETGTYRSGSFLTSPLVLGFYLAGVTPFAVAMATVRSRWRPLVLLCVGVCVAGLVVTITRSAYIGGFLGILTVFGLTVRNAAIRVSLAGMLVVITGAFVLANVTQGGGTLLREESTRGHTETLEADLRLVVARPLGYGLGTTDRFAQTTGAGPGVVGSTESSYFAVALEAGIGGLFLYLTALFVIGMRLRARRRIRDPGKSTGAMLAAGAIGSVIAIALSGLFLGIHELVVETVLWGAPAIALGYRGMRAAGA